ncbi:uncharacterized protein [Manis javanica]|uniref:uncharacterized protein isoform X3 n=1 Tax=Manis javanica TaxID=9974 RepID=UPI003C6D8F05
MPVTRCELWMGSIWIPFKNEGWRWGWSLRKGDGKEVTLELVSPWNYYKFILRACCLVLSILATLMILSTVDGRMAHVQGSYTGYLGIWPNCGRHRCANLDQVTVLAHMSTGFMMLALSLSVILLLAMCLSLRPVFWCLNKVDLVFSSLSFITGFLIVLSMALFVIQCETLRPKPQVSYLPITYLCWGAGALMLWAGILSYLNYMGICSKVRFFMERRMSYRRWVSQRGALRSASQQQSEPDTKHTVHLPSSLTLPGTPPDSQDTNQKPRLGAGPAPFIVAVRPLDLP